MRTFHCDHCQQLVFFENFQCVNCEHPLAYLPDFADMGSLETAGTGLWQARQPGAEGRVFRLCKNYTLENVCNWAVAAEDANPLCQSCRLTRIIPELAKPGHRTAWYRLEVAKRRLIYGLLGLRLPLRSKLEDPENGLAFEFLADPDLDSPGTVQSSAPVLTGHKEGVITVNVNEADDAEREKRRLALHEPYRTVLGHFRHEIAHYFWERLLSGSSGAANARLDEFRGHFGDERADYAKALQQHYQQGPPADWQNRFVTAYASAHPWEDWAETWAHYMHITDTLETAISSGLSLRPILENPRPENPREDDNREGKRAHTGNLMIGCRPASFERMINAWFPLTHLLNNLNRGLGLTDAYPFVLSTPAIEKLRFVHETIEAAAR
jgi:hypothetical protein